MPNSLETVRFALTICAVLFLLAEPNAFAQAPAMTADYLQQQGANTPIEGLRQWPRFIGNTATENDSERGNGSAFINLLGLGPQNTLTLINGRRAFTFRDINAISMAALSRVEALKDSASAIYGSDAVAGVVNLILLNGPGERPYEGAELYALYGNTTDKDAHVRQVYVRGGVVGLEGKVSIAATGEYYSRANLYSRDREISRSADTSNNPTGLGWGGTNRNSPTYPGRVSVAGSGARVLIDQSINNPTPGRYRAFDPDGPGTDPFRFDFREFTPAIPAVEKAMYLVTGRYKIFGNGLQLYGDIMYSKTKQDNGLAPVPFSVPSGGYTNAGLFVPFVDPRTGNAFGLLTAPSGTPPTATSQFLSAAQRSIIQNSPFNPFPGRDRFNFASGNYQTPAGAITNSGYRFIQELGNRRSFYDNDYYRYVVGINGDFEIAGNALISRFGYDSGFVYERHDQKRTDSGDVTRGGIYQEIINSATIPGYVGFNPFIGETAPTAGIAPIYNAAGVQTGTQAYDNTAAAQRASYIGQSFFYERDWLADAKVYMHLFPNLWNGGIDLGAGYEHREIAQHQVPDPIQAAGDQLGFSALPNTKYVQEVNSIFAELILPIVTSTMSVPFVRSLEFALFYRYEEFDDRDQYSKATASFDNENEAENFGGSPRISVRYQPISDLTLRGSWGQSFHAPEPALLFEPITQTFPVLFSIVGFFPQPLNGYFVGGNVSLRPEQTDTYTAGIVWTPKFIPGFTAAVDWYQLSTTDVIVDRVDVSQVLLSGNIIAPYHTPDDCGRAGNVGIIRDPDSSSLYCINSYNTNAGKRNVQGIEITASYELPTERFGKFTFTGGWNHFFTWNLQPGFDPYQSFLGRYDNGTFPQTRFSLLGTRNVQLAPGAIPWNKGFLRGEWEWRHFDFVATGNYIGDFQDDSAYLQEFGAVRTVPSYITLDMQLSYEFVKPDAGPVSYAKDSKDSKNVMQSAADTSSIWQRMLWGTKLTVGVNDAFDRQPPSVLGAFNDNYDTSLYTIRNRYWYVSVNKKF